MQNEIKLLCNHCYQPLELDTYDIGTFVNRCQCDIEENLDKAWNDGYDEGKCDGNNHGYDNGLEDGRKEENHEYERKIKKLEEKIKKLEERIEKLQEQFIEDDEYFERIGT